MKKIVLVVLLLAVVLMFSNSKGEEMVDANTTMERDTRLDNLTSTNIMFSGESNGVGVDILFEWADGKFNIVYDANNCTETAQVFFDCMLPYLNEHIKEKAKLLKE